MSHEIDLKNFEIRTDLAVELVDTNPVLKDGIKITEIILTDLEAKKIGKKKGNYITIEFDDITDYENKEKVKTIFTEELEKVLKKQNIKKDDLCLIIGLGNDKSTPDSLGPLTIEKVMVTNYLYLFGELEDGFRRVCALSPGVMGETGIETSDLIQSIKESVNPDFIIVIDALAASSVERVNKTIQISDSGINPGSGVGNKRKEISKDILGVPVIAIGVPTVVDAASIVNDTINYMYFHFAYQKDNYNKPKNKLTYNVNYLKYGNKTIKIEDRKRLLGIIGSLNQQETKSLINEILNPIGYNMMVTPKEEDFIIDKLSSLISEGLNSVLHKNV